MDVPKIKCKSKNTVCLLPKVHLIVQFAYKCTVHVYEYDIYMYVYINLHVMSVHVLLLVGVDATYVCVCFVKSFTKFVIIFSCF